MRGGFCFGRGGRFAVAAGYSQQQSGKTKQRLDCVFSFHVRYSFSLDKLLLLYHDLQKKSSVSSGLSPQIQEIVQNLLHYGTELCIMI